MAPSPATSWAPRPAARASRSVGLPQSRASKRCGLFARAIVSGKGRLLCSSDQTLGINGQQASRPVVVHEPSPTTRSPGTTFSRPASGSPERTLHRQISRSGRPRWALRPASSASHQESADDLFTMDRTTPAICGCAAGAHEGRLAPAFLSPEVGCRRGPGCAAVRGFL